MAQSSRIKLQEFRSIYRLIGEVRELGAVPEAWRTHLLNRLKDILQTRAGFVIQARSYVQGNTAPLASIVSIGMNGREYQMFMRFLAEGLQDDPMNQGMIKLFLRHQDFTCVRRDVVPDDGVWYRSNNIEDFSRPLGVDDQIHSEVFLPGNQGSHSIYMMRDFNDRRPMGHRERTLLHLLHSELHRIWDSTPSNDASQRLPPRLAQALSFLRAGYGEKQIAFRLGLSRHSVHDLIKRLHRKFAVDGRAELLAASQPAAPKFYPCITT